MQPRIGDPRLNGAAVGAPRRLSSTRKVFLTPFARGFDLGSADRTQRKICFGSLNSVGRRRGFIGRRPRGWGPMKQASPRLEMHQCIRTLALLMTARRLL